VKRLPFKTELVRAQDDGAKWITRRLLNPAEAAIADRDGPNAVPPRFTPGELVARQEGLVRVNAVPPTAAYASDLEAVRGAAGTQAWVWRRSSLTSRFLRSEHVRRYVRVVHERVERLSEVTDYEAWAEGIARFGIKPTAEAFVYAFREMHKLQGADPWVRRIVCPVSLGARQTTAEQREQVWQVWNGAYVPGRQPHLSEFPHVEYYRAGAPDDPFRASWAAEAVAGVFGLGVGSTQSGAPTALFWGQDCVPKWRNLTPTDRQGMDGVILSDRGQCAMIATRKPLEAYRASRG
jgi:hypothetical protein